MESCRKALLGASEGIPILPAEIGLSRLQAGLPRPKTIEVSSVIFGGSCRMNNPEELLEATAWDVSGSREIGLSVRGDIPMRVIMQILRN